MSSPARASANEGHVAGTAKGYFRPRQWPQTIHRMNRAEMARLRTIWDETARGTLPLSFTPPDGGGAIPVVIVDPDLLWRQLSSQAAIIEVTLEEWFG